MRPALAQCLFCGVAFGAMTLAAEAQPDRRDDHVFIRSIGGPGMDADEDGWVTRAEATASAERIFGELDRNDDGKLDQGDRPNLRELDIGGDEIVHGDGRRVHVFRGEDGDRVVRIERDGDGEDGDVIIERIERDGDGDGDRHVERHVERLENGDRVTIIRRGDGARHAGGPMPPHPPIFMGFAGSNEEFDRNSDGALSLEEFRNQQLRQFDASDGNGDGRVRQPMPMRWEMRAPEPPTPPTAPTPPTPPRRR